MAPFLGRVFPAAVVVLTAPESGETGEIKKLPRAGAGGRASAPSTHRNGFRLLRDMRNTPRALPLCSRSRGTLGHEGAALGAHGEALRRGGQMEAPLRALGPLGPGLTPSAGRRARGLMPQTCPEAPRVDHS